MAKIGKINRKIASGRATANGLVGASWRHSPNDLSDDRNSSDSLRIPGRIWQIRHDEVEQRSSFALPTGARIPHPTSAETYRLASTSTAHCYLEKS
jgi:hypothetical protein